MRTASCFACSQIPLRRSNPVQLTMLPKSFAVSSSLQLQRRFIRIQDPDTDIKTYWRKETEQIRAKNSGVPLGSAEVEGEAFEEYIKLKTANGNVIDNTKMAKWFTGVLFVAFFLPSVIGEQVEEPGAEYTPYVKPTDPSASAEDAPSSSTATTQ